MINRTEIVIEMTEIMIRMGIFFVVFTVEQLLYYIQTNITGANITILNNFHCFLKKKNRNNTYMVV